jgi:hypothetical protein
MCVWLLWCMFCVIDYCQVALVLKLSGQRKQQESAANSKMNQTPPHSHHMSANDSGDFHGSRHQNGTSRSNMSVSFAMDSVSEVLPSGYDTHMSKHRGSGRGSGSGSGSGRSINYGNASSLSTSDQHQLGKATANNNSNRQQTISSARKQQQRFSNIQHQGDLKSVQNNVCNCSMSQHPHQHHQHQQQHQQHNQESVIFDEGLTSSSNLMMGGGGGGGKSGSGHKPKMAFFRRVE